jgi:plasmid segregation protein ParM
MPNNINTQIQIDLGYYYTCNSSKQSIRSKVELTTETPNTINSNSILQYQHDDTRAIVGESASQHPIELNKTKNIAYQILTYSLITKSLTPKTPTNINLVINYPLNIYNSKSKSEFESFIKTPDFINIFINSIQFTFHIQKCLTFPQTIPVAYIHPQHFQNSIHSIIDIGGLTCQGIILDNFNPIPNTKFSESLGSIILYNQIRKNLNSVFNLNIQDYEIPHIINSGLPSHLISSKSLINSIIDSHISEIIKYLKFNNWNIETIPIMFTGGGSLLIKSHLLKRFPSAIFSSNPLYDNVLGLKVVSDSVFKMQTQMFQH